MIISWLIAKEKHRLFPKVKKLYQDGDGVRLVNEFTLTVIVLIKTWVSEIRIKF